MDTINKNELLPTLDCIFGDIPYNKLPSELKKLTNEYRMNIKDEIVLCVNDFVSPTETIYRHINTPVNVLLSQGFSSVNRQESENFSSYIQLITSVLIHDGENMLLLNNLYSNKVYQRGTLSYVQGHVEFPNNTFLTLGEVLRQNMIKELEEELGEINDLGHCQFNKLSIPITAIYLPVAPSTNKHCCVLYELEVEDVNNFYCKEHNKNGVISMRIDQIHTQYNYLCPWVLQSLQHSQCVKDVYLEYLKNLKY